MYISNEVALIQSDLYFYDFKTCAYSLLNNLDWDMGNININNKEERNIKIGKLQINNPQMSDYLNQSMNNLIDLYISENNISKSDIVIRQKDGIICKKPITNLDLSLPLPLRELINKLVISLDRKKFVYISNNGSEYTVKGITTKTKSMSYFNMFKTLDFFSKRSLLQLDKIRQELYTSDNIEWFMLINKKDLDKFSLVLLDGSYITISEESINMIDIKELDLGFIWINNIWPFAESILLSNV